MSDSEVEEREVMPGVYLTDYSQRRRAAAATPAASANTSEEVKHGVPSENNGEIDGDGDLSNYTTEELLAATQRLQARAETIRAETAASTAELAQLRAAAAEMIADAEDVVATSTATTVGSSGGHRDSHPSPDAVPTTTYVPGALANVIPAMPGFTPAQALDQLEFQLRTTENTLSKLEASQATLVQVLASDPSDEIIKDAVAENGPIIVKKRGEIASLKAHIAKKKAEMGPHYADAPAAPATNAAPTPAAPEAAAASAPITAPPAGDTPASAPQEEPEADGIFL